MKLFYVSMLSMALTACGSANKSAPEENTNTENSNEGNEQIQQETAVTYPSTVVSKSTEWTLVWQDEFDDSEIDMSKWSFEVNCWGGGNEEQQCYTDRADNAYIDNGNLVIKAIKESFTGPSENQDSPNYNASVTTTLPYTSARLRSKNKGDWKYGRFEISAKLPSGQGTWPAIWMLPTDWAYGDWAGSGEIDIMEAVNLGADSDEKGRSGEPELRVHGTLHYGRAWPGNVHAGTGFRLPNDANPADDFHEYAIEWEEGEIRWYVDDIHFATQTQDGWFTQYMQDGSLITGEGAAPFDQTFHMILNVAVGGGWAGSVNERGIDANVFPQTMLVDYVRVYECSVDTETGQGCAAKSDEAILVEGH